MSGPPTSNPPPVLDSWLHPVLVYAIGCGLGEVACYVATAEALRPFVGYRDEIWPIILAWPALCFEVWILKSIAGSWQESAGQTTAGIVRYWWRPGWCTLLIGVGIGALTGCVLFGIVLMPIPILRELTGLLAMFVGPLSGIGWILARSPEGAEMDYDEVRRRTDERPAEAIDVSDLAATEAFGRRLGRLLFPNAIVALIGPLGAGKTHLTRAIAEGLDIANPTAVTSPTYTLVHEYPARLAIYHFDAYRLDGANSFLDLGATEYYSAGGVCLIEWADRVASALPSERLEVHITPTGVGSRRIDLIVFGNQYVELARRLSQP